MSKDSDAALVSIVIPIYFEEQVVRELYNRLKQVLADIGSHYRYEIIFVNDGSKDRSLKILHELHLKDSTVRIIDFSRNFGHQIAITAGIDNAAGDAVIVMDGDLQDPPEVIIDMIAKWEEGYKVVYGVRSVRKGDSTFKLVTAKLFYIIINKLSDVKLPLDAGDFRLMDRVVVNALTSMREQNRYIRGMVSWVGFPQCGLHYERDARYAGKTKYTLKKMIKFALDGIISFSDKPLHYSNQFGLLITTLSFLLALWVIINKIIHPSLSIQGWTSILVVILFLGGIQLISVGILGEYIGRLMREIKDRPLYIVAQKYGYNENGEPKIAEIRTDPPIISELDAPESVEKQEIYKLKGN